MAENNVHTDNNKRIAKNTVALYFRMAITMVITLYTSRVILRALGVEDYGIYDAVGGFVAMFAVISNSLSAAISRFITIELGQGNCERMKKIFSTAVIIQVIISSFLVIISLTVGVWFLNTQMVIPENRIIAANCVFVFSVLTFVVNLISVPYNASIVAHEQMKAFAYIGIFDAVGRLAIAFAISVSTFDRLIFYAMLMCGLSLFIRFVYGWYCRRNFEECRFKLVFDKCLIKEIFGFAGWNFIGAASGVLKDQGVNVLLNLFGGPVLNSARGIAVQVSTAVTQFSNNFIVALNPQITKSYANNNNAYMITLIEKGAKISYFLLFVISLPIIINAPYILRLWIGEYPEYTVVFVRLMVLISLHESISSTLITGMLATGKIRNYQIIVGGIQMINLPISYLVLRLGCQPPVVLVVAFALSVLCLAARVYMLRGMINLKAKEFVVNVYIRILVVTIVSSMAPLALYFYYNDGFWAFVLNCIACLVSSTLFIYLIGCNNEERTFLNDKLKNVFKTAE